MVVAKTVELWGDRDCIGSYYFDVVSVEFLELFFGPAEKVGVFTGIGGGYFGMFAVEGGFGPGGSKEDIKRFS
ncbi:MAG: hypothetical protein ACD_61C00260G0001 [uncultured bacterium]|nr:MAG: hypothetical protein ACD_61C00260G0001 [uncultured bacterium]